MHYLVAKGWIKRERELRDVGRESSLALIDYQLKQVFHLPVK